MKKHAKKKKSSVRRWQDHAWSKSDSILHARLSSRELLVNLRVCACLAETTISAWVSRVLSEAVEREFQRPEAKRFAKPHEVLSCCDRALPCQEPYYVYASGSYCEKHYPMGQFQQPGRRRAK